MNLQCTISKTSPYKAQYLQVYTSTLLLHNINSVLFTIYYHLTYLLCDICINFPSSNFQAFHIIQMSRTRVSIIIMYCWNIIHKAMFTHAVE